MPIEVLFYQSNNLSLQQIFLIQSVYSVSIVLWEIPSGYFADRFGRRNTLFIGSVAGFAGYAVYSFSSGFWMFAAAEILLGFGYSLISGADSALLYDTLQAGRKTSRYLKIEGRSTSLGNFAEAIGGITGGLLAVISLRMPYYFQTAIVLSGVVASFLLKDPKMTHQELKKHSWKDVFRTVKYTFHDNVRLKWAILFSAIMGTATLSMAWLAQPFFKEIGLPVAAIGIAWTILNVTVGLASMFAYKTEQKMGSLKFNLIYSATICGTCLLLGFFFSYYGLLLLLIFYVGRGFATPALKNYVNIHATSDVRATVLSLRAFVIRIVFAVVGPVLGWTADHYSLKLTFILAGIFFTISTFVIFIFFVKNKAMEK